MAESEVSVQTPVILLTLRFSRPVANMPELLENLASAIERHVEMNEIIPRAEDAELDEFTLAWGTAKTTRSFIGRATW